MHVDGGEQVLEHSSHELHVHAKGAEAVEHQEGRMGELLLMHAMAAQRGDHVTCQCVLQGGVRSG